MGATGKQLTSGDAKMLWSDGRLTPSGFYLFSYPRSGSNWIFNALAYLLGAMKAEARMGEELYPHAYGETGPSTFWIQTAAEWRGDRPIVIKSHDTLEVAEAIYPAGKKMYLLRDGRDALLSYYFFQRAFVVNPTNKTIFPVGSQGQDLGAVSGNDVRFDPAGYAGFLRSHAPAWAEHARNWSVAHGVLQLRYETLLSDFQGELARIAAFVDLPHVRSIREVSQEYVENARNLFTGDNHSVHRKGAAGDWRNYAGDGIHAILKEELGDALIALGYEADMQW
jgi:hypothetical protein